MNYSTTLPRVIVAGLAGCSEAPEPSRACLDASTIEILDAHVEQMRISAALLAGHAGEREATAFFQFPGLELMRSALYAGPLVETCSAPLLYEEHCEEDGLCSRLECTGMGAGWEFHLRLLAQVVSGSFRYESASIDTAWADGDDGITFLLASEAARAPTGLKFEASCGFTLSVLLALNDFQVLDGGCATQGEEVLARATIACAVALLLSEMREFVLDHDALS